MAKTKTVTWKEGRSAITGRFEPVKKAQGKKTSEVETMKRTVKKSR